MYIKKYCKDCEPSQQSHLFSYISNLLDFLFAPLENFFEKNFQKIKILILKKGSLPIMQFLVFLNLAYFNEKITKVTLPRAKCLWEEAEKRNIKMKEFIFFNKKDSFVAKYKNETIIFSGLPHPKNNKPNSLLWSDNKSIMKKKFKKQNFPIAKGGTAFTLRKAYKIFEKIEKPVIIKPNIGSRGRHTTININNIEKLKQAYKKAKKMSPFVIIEEELSGDLYRATLINKKFIASVKREPPFVIGNGINTIQELLNKENQKKQRDNIIFNKIIINDNLEIELQKQNIKLNEIPKNNQKILLSKKSAIELGGSTTDVTNITNKDTIKLLEEIAKYLDNDIIGIDFIVKDIKKSIKNQKKAGIIETNSLPFINLHHYVMEGEPQNVAGKIWDLIFKDYKK